MRKYLTAILCCICMTTIGCNFLGSLDLMKPADDEQSQPDAEIEYTEQQHWDAIAAYVEGGQLKSTDELLVVAEWLQSLEYLKDLSRLDGFREANEIIDNSNKNHISNTVTGGN